MRRSPITGSRSELFVLGLQRPVYEGMTFEDLNLEWWEEVEEDGARLLVFQGESDDDWPVIELVDLRGESILNRGDGESYPKRVTLREAADWEQLAIKLD